MNITTMGCLIAAASIAITGCMPRVNKAADEKQHQAVEQALNAQLPDTSRTGSLWANGGNGLLSDPKAARVGDLVTVLVSENAKATRSLGSKQSKKSDRKVGGTVAMDFSASPRLVQTSAASLKGSGNTGITNSKTFDGSGSTNNSDTLTASVTSVVMHVYPNGNMRIVGKRVLNVNHEPQEITFSGVIRPIDITASNTISSSKVAQVHISYGGTGALATVAHEGWLSQTLDQIWPF